MTEQGKLEKQEEKTETGRERKRGETDRGQTKRRSEVEGERAGGWGGGREGKGAFTGPRPGAASPGASHTRFPAPALPLPLLSVHLLASTVQLMQGSRHAKHKRDGAVGGGG